MRALDPLALQALKEVPRAQFVASPDLSAQLSGHSIPSTLVVRTLLGYLPALSGREQVLLIGAGSGYLPVILARLVRQVQVIERSPEILAIARANIAKLMPTNLHLHSGDGRQGAAIEGVTMQRGTAVAGELPSRAGVVSANVGAAQRVIAALMQICLELLRDQGHQSAPLPRGVGSLDDQDRLGPQAGAARQKSELGHQAH